MSQFIDIQKSLASWYEQNKRELPWRANQDPYSIWLSEIILQQTRIDQGTAYYLKFIDRFPRIEDLAEAEEDEVLKLWQGLGYYSRARNLLYTAKTIQREFNGVFPKNYEEIKNLKGIGPYTASAIASIAFNQPVAAVDGNVSRVISRLFGIHDPINKPRGFKQIQAIADELLDKSNPGQHNQAMMEFGALQCTPKSPACGECILSVHCSALKEATVDQLPKKEGKVKRRSRYFHYIIVQNGSRIILNQRTKSDIWQGLFEFPMIETKDSRELEINEIHEQIDGEIELIRVNETTKHVLSHQDIFARFYHVKAEFKSENKDTISIEKLHEYALPRLIDRYLESHDLMTGKKR